jgi:hypothetical protein
MPLKQCSSPRLHNRSLRASGGVLSIILANLQVPRAAQSPGDPWWKNPLMRSIYREREGYFEVCLANNRAVPRPAKQ